MPQKTTLTPEVREALKGVTYLNNDTHVKLNCGQVSYYKEINEVLTRIGGKWKGGKTAAHVFPYPVKPVLTAIVHQGIMPEKNPHDFFPTPDEVLEQVLNDNFKKLDFLNLRAKEGNLSQNHRILEPSGGTGSIIKKLLTDYPHLKGHIDAVEIDPIKVELLQSFEAGNVYNADFLTWEKDPEITYIGAIMNPPFSNKAKIVYSEHIEKAFETLSKDHASFLFSIVPTNWLFQDSKRMNEFRNFVFEFGEFFLLPNQSFKKSGTTIDTAFIQLENLPGKTPSWEENENGLSYHAYQAVLTIENSQKYINDLQNIQQASSFAQALECTQNTLPKVLKEHIEIESGFVINETVIQQIAEHFYEGELPLQKEKELTEPKTQMELLLPEA